MNKGSWGHTAHSPVEKTDDDTHADSSWGHLEERGNESRVGRITDSDRVVILARDLHRGDFTSLAFTPQGPYKLKCPRICSSSEDKYNKNQIPE